MHLDPAGEPVKDTGRLSPAVRFEAGLARVLPEAPAVVDGANPLAQVLLAHALGDDSAPEQHLAEPRSLLLKEGDELERKAEVELAVQAADLEGRDHAHGPVVLAAAAVGVAVRADGERSLTGGPVASHERAHGVVGDAEAQAL